MKNCLVANLGLVEYGAAREIERRLVAARKAGAVPDVLLLCEHPHVITQGRAGRRQNLLAPERVLAQMGVKYFDTDRGGDITYHGPGQLVAYPILQLGAIRRDVGWYVRQLEETMIRTSADFGIASTRVSGMTGVWAAPLSRGAKTPEGMPQESVEKLGAIGVHISRWVTSHGMAYNVATDLRYFDLIVPCGLAGRRATSLEKLLDRPVSVAEVAPRMTRHLEKVLGLEMRDAAIPEIERQLAEFEASVQTPVVA
ncbi:MAG: lipoyl(octanoyl) transferase LipB [Candidatus Acidiferrales bacterium]